MEGTPTATPVVQTQMPVQGNQPTSDAKSAPVEDIELDFGDFKAKRSDVAKRLKQQDEIVKGANVKFQEAAQIRKQSAEAFELRDLLTKDVRAALTKAGVKREDMVRAAEAILGDEITEASMDPRDRELRDAKAEAKRLKEAQDHHEAEYRKQQEQHDIGKYETYLGDGFADAIKRKGVPLDPVYVKRMADKLEAYWEAGENVSFDQLADEVLYEEDNNSKRRLQSWDDDQLMAWLGEEGKERIRKKLLANANVAPQAQKPSANGNRQQKPNSPRKRMTEQQLKQLVKQRINQ